MSQLPPTFLKTTLFTNEVRGNVTVKGAVIIQSNGNAFALSNTSIITGIGASPLPTNIIGNVSGVYANVTTVNAANVNATGNVSASYFLGNGALLTGIEQYVLPSEITADVLGNVTATGNVSAEYFLGNGALLSGIETYVLPSEITADVLGNVTATGNVSAEYFLGNGALLSGIEQYVLPSEITADVLGNVTATGNISGTYILGNGALLTGIEQYALPSQINADLHGNVTATGNVTADYFIGNGYNLILDGYTLKPMGNVANIAVRLALPAPVGTIVKQTDEDQEYLLLATPASVDENWLEFTGANFPVMSVFGRTGNVLLLSGVDVNTIGGTSIVGNGDITSLSVDITGNVTAAGNVSAEYFLGNGALLSGIEQYVLPSEITADVLGNVTATGNVSAEYFLGNGALLTGIEQYVLPSEITADVLGNVTATGNVSAEYFLGNGALLTGIEQYVLPSVANIDIMGNVLGNVIGYYANVIEVYANYGNIAGVVLMSGSVTASSLSGDVLGNVSGNYAYVNEVAATYGSVGGVSFEGGNVVASGQVNVTGNVAAEYFLGNGALLSGIEQYVLPSEITADVLGNVTATGNVSAEYFLGNGALLTGIEQYVLPSEITADVLGNVTATGNVSAEYFLGNGALLTGIEQYVLPSEITADVLGNVTATGNVSAEYFLGNGALLTGIEQYVLPSEITADVLGNVTATGNVSAEYFLGNGALLSGIEQYVLPSEITADVLGNVTATGNVSAEYFLGNGALLSGIEQYVLPSEITADVLGNVTATGNVSAEYFLGNGALLAGVLTEISGNLEITNILVSGNVDVSNNVNVAGNVVTGKLYTADAYIGNVNSGQVVSGNITSNEFFFGNGAFITGIEQYVLPSEITADVLGNVTATGNVSAEYFLGNGALLSGIEQYVLPSEITADVLGNVTATGNVSANLFVGNGALLTGIGQNISGNLNIENIVATGNVTADYFVGNGYNLILDGYTLKPMGNVANIAVRLALPAPIGTIVKQVDEDQEYLLLATPASVDENWLEFTGANFPVMSVFGRTGNVVLISGTDVNTIGGTSIVGNGDITSLSVDILGNVTATGNVSADYFLGNGALLTGIEQYVLPSEITADVLGNVTATGNVSAEYFLGNGALLTGIEQYVLPSEITADVLGNVTATGNVSAEYFLGNGALLEGVATALPSVANIDIIGNVLGNVIGYYANVIEVYANYGNIAGVVLMSGSITASTLSGDVLGNVSGNYAYVNEVAATYGSVGGVSFEGGNVVASGQVNVTGNVAAEYFLGNGALLSGIEQYVLPSEITADVLGNVTATGNVSAEYFLGNGALLTDVVSTIPDEITTDVFGNVTATGNVSAEYFLGNGVYLDGTATLNSSGFINQQNLDGYLTIPQGYVADEAARLALGGGALPVGSVVRQADDGNSYLLTATPSNVDLNWLEFEGANFPVNTVFGRTGDVLASFGDYSDDVIELTSNIGPVPAGNALVEALEYLSESVTTSITLSGNATAAYFLGNGALLTGVTAILPTTVTADVLGNVTATGNVTAAGQVNVTGNITASYFLGNGALLEGVATALPSVANIDVSGNVIGSYANVTTLIGTTGNVGNTRFVGGNVAVSGQVNALGNVVAPFFVGNGSQLTGIAAALPGVIAEDIVGNIIGTYANVNNVIAITGNIGNTILSGGNVTVSGNIVATRGISASFFVGNGSLLTGITPPARYLAAVRSSNQTIASGTWSNIALVMDSVRESAGITYNSTTGVITLEGGVTYRITAQLGWTSSTAYTYGFRLVNSTTNVQIGPEATTSAPTSSSTNAPGPLLDIILTPSTTTDYRLRTSNGLTSAGGEQIRSDSGTFLNIVGLGSGFTSGLPSTGNVDIIGNVTAPGNITVAGQVNVTGNVAANYYRGNGALLTGIPNGPSVSVFFGNLATQTINTIGNTTPLYSNVVYDTVSGFSLATRAYTPGVAGYYHVDASCSWGSTVAAGQMQLHLLKNGTRHKTLVQTPATGASQNYITSGSYIVQLSNTDSITVSVAQTMGNAQTIIGGVDTGFTATLISK